MSANFEVQTDNIGRILGFHTDSSEELITPEAIGEYLDGNETVSHQDIEYFLDERGNLTNPDTEIPPNVSLGYGVLIGAGVNFAEPDRGQRRKTKIDNRVLILPEGFQEIGIGSHIYHRAVCLGELIGENSLIQAHTILSSGSSLGDGVMTGKSVKIGHNVTVERDVWIKRDTVVGDWIHIYPELTIGRNCKIKMPDDAPGDSIGYVKKDIRPYMTALASLKPLPDAI